MALLATTLLVKAAATRLPGTAGPDTMTVRPGRADTARFRRATGRGTVRSTTIRTRPRASRCRRSPTTAVRRRTGNIGAVAGVNGYSRCGCVPGPHLLPSRNTVRLEPRCAFRREATSAPVSVTKGRHAGRRSCPPAVGPLPSSCYLQLRPSPIVGGAISGRNAADGKDLRPSHDKEVTMNSDSPDALEPEEGGTDVLGSEAGGTDESGLRPAARTSWEPRPAAPMSSGPSPAARTSWEPRKAAPTYSATSDAELGSSRPRSRLRGL